MEVGGIKGGGRKGQQPKGGKKGGKKGLRPVMKTEFLPSDVYRMAVHLGRIAIEEMMSKGIALPTKR